VVHWLFAKPRFFRGADVVEAPVDHFPGGEGSPRLSSLSRGVTKFSGDDCEIWVIRRRRILHLDKDVHHHE
jgi:hypothetical protein